MSYSGIERALLMIRWSLAAASSALHRPVLGLSRAVEEAKLPEVDEMQGYCVTN